VQASNGIAVVAKVLYASSLIQFSPSRRILAPASVPAALLPTGMRRRLLEQS
jgi:hypothetical protein